MLKFSFLILVTGVAVGCNFIEDNGIGGSNRSNGLPGASRSFLIQGNTFLKDGKPFRYISGSFHYFRSVWQKWDDILRKLKLCGLNAVETYVEWSSHQPSPREEYLFEGNLDLIYFLELAQKNGLLVILRPGPYIDAERDMGGLPAWLLWQKQGIELRTSDLDYNYFVSKWFDHLLPKLVPYLYQNGGPIILVQVENEYGSFGCDKNYTIFVRDLIRRNLGPDVILITTDGSGERNLECGTIPGVYPTVDFGAGSDPAGPFGLQDKFSAGGPRVNSEFYTGWLDHWEEPHSAVDSALVTRSLEGQFADFSANVNFYMFYGGTSYGFSAGSNDNGIFEACPTSYDYDAPLNEAGDPTEKYFEIRETIRAFSPVPDVKPVISPKGNYGRVEIKPFSFIFHEEFIQSLDSRPINSSLPLSFEELKLDSGFILYETVVQFLSSDPALLSAPQIKDRAYIYVDQVLVGVLSRTEKITQLPIRIRKEGKLHILVENQGRVCFGPHIGDSKGLGRQVSLGKTSLLHWKMYPLGKLQPQKLHKLAQKYFRKWGNEFALPINSMEGSGMFYYGSITLPLINGTLLDTFVRFDGWTKGVLWVNDFCLGKYWPVVGPQETLYLPAPLLNPPPKKNHFILFELESAPKDCVPSIGRNFLNNCNVLLTQHHVLNGETPYKGNRLNNPIYQSRTQPNSIIH